MIKRHSVKSCCRTSSFIFETPIPINKKHLKTFTDAGYVAPPSFLANGVFYVRGHGVIATSAYGAKRINVKCSGNNCKKLLNQFEALLLKAVMS